MENYDPANSKDPLIYQCNNLNLHNISFNHPKEGTYAIRYQ